MKACLLLIAFLALSLVDQSCAVAQPRNEPLCLPDDDFFAPGPECYNFYECRNGVLEMLDCPPGMLFDRTILWCNWEEDVQCEDEQTTIITEAPTTVAPTAPPTTSTPSNTFMPDTEGALPILFPGSECPPDIRAFLVHATECRRYSYCLYGIEYPQICPFLQTFNYVVGHCVPRDPMYCFPGSVA
ncbi:uncharacterized protein LOC118508079 [Anopheles stephensi]|uniref:uncharacterized protein LOC118508079 n=1 Tax=Anopheles stephensi TaxID=30069 RepID=UPI00165888E1|nr:uncharacterized protein LOC118508079 [Anopheles stephensi]